jgi:hypothetical protein
MGGSEEGAFDVVFGVERQQSVKAYICTEDAAGNFGWVRGTAVAGIDPAGDGVDVNYCVSVKKAIDMELGGELP